MRAAVISLLLGSLLAATPGLAIDPRDFESPAEEARYRGLLEELRCLVCQNETLAGSNAPLAKDLRDEVMRMIRQGYSDAEIHNFLTARYGDFVLYRPPFRPSTWALWLGPGLLLLIGAGLVYRRVRQAGQGGNSQPPPDDWPVET